MKKFFSILLLVMFVPIAFVFSACKTRAASADRTSIKIYYLNGQQPATKMLKTNEKLNIENPSSNYFDFEGWYVDKDYTKPFDINGKVGYINTLYAKWKQKEGLLGNEKVAADIQQLIIAAEMVDYSGRKAQIAVAQYLRSSRYTSGEWNILCGVVPDAVYEKISDEYSELGYLRNLGSIYFGEQSIDFVHFAATLNAVIRSGETSGTANLCGYVGDLAQVVVSVYGDNKDEIYSQAQEMIGAQNGVFSASDFWADLLAVVIGRAAKDRETSFAEIMCEYLNKTELEIINQFLNICFEDKTREGLIQSIRSKLDGMLVRQWIENNGDDVTDLQKDMASAALADYLLSFVGG